MGSRRLALGSLLQGPNWVCVKVVVVVLALLLLLFVSSFASPDMKE